MRLLPAFLFNAFAASGYAVYGVFLKNYDFSIILCLFLFWAAICAIATNILDLSISSIIRYIKLNPVIAVCLPIFLVIYFYFFIAGLAKTSALTAAVAMALVVPATTIAASWKFKDKNFLLSIVFGVIIFAGVVVFKFEGGTFQVSLLGATFLLVAIFADVFSHLMKASLAEGTRDSDVLVFTFFSALILSFLAVLAGPGSFEEVVEEFFAIGWGHIAVAWLGIVPTFLAMVFQLISNSKIGKTNTVASTGVKPLLAYGWYYVLAFTGLVSSDLIPKFSSNEVIGISIIVVGYIIFAIMERK